MIIILVKSCETLGASRYLKVFCFLQVFKEPLYITDFLQRAKAVLSKDNLTLRVYLPLDFALPIEDTFITTAIYVHSLSGTEMSLQVFTRTPPNIRVGRDLENGQLKGRGLLRARVKIIILQLEQPVHVYALSCLKCTVRTARGNKKETAKLPRSSKRSLSGASGC